MTREMIAADLLSPLAPLLVSLLVALACLPSLAGFASGARRGSTAFAGSPRRGRASGSLAGAGLSCVADSTGRDPVSAAGERPAVFGLPLLTVRWLKARPS
jgi:hypothetical protein